MNHDPSPSQLSVHLPLTLLAIAGAIFLAAQWSAVAHGGRTVTWQRENLEKQSANLKEAQAQLAQAIVKRDEVVQQSNKVQQQYRALFEEVIDLAKTDPDAARIVTKYNIQISSSPAESGSVGAGTTGEAK